MKKILLIDAFGIIFRSYYAFINRPLKNKNGENISAVFGFFKSILSILKNQNPDEILIALEGKGECFRNKIYPQYKANRSETPEDLKEQIIKIIDLIDKLGFPHFYQDGYEADDIIGTLSDLYSKKDDVQVIIFSSDKDLRQLVNEKVILCRPDPKSLNNIFLDIEGIFQDMGIYPAQVADYLALTGDSSDNIPGVAGIGPKSAEALLKTWGSLDNIYKNLESVVPVGVKKKLTECRDAAFISKSLTIIKKDIQLDLDEQQLSRKPLDISNARDTLEADGMRSLIEEIISYNKSVFGVSDKEENGEAVVDVPVGKNISDIAKKFILIKNNSLLSMLSDEIKKQKSFSYDLETTGFDCFEDDIICMSISLPDESTYIVPFELKNNEDKNFLDVKDIINILKPVFSDDSILKIGHNLKFDNKFLYRYGVSGITNIFDTMLAEYCIDAGSSSYGMKDLGEKYLNYDMIRYEDVVKDPKKQTLLDTDIDSLVRYSGQDAFVTYKLYEVINKRLSENKKALSLFNDIEIPLSAVLMDMELTGVFVNLDHLIALSKMLEVETKKLYEKMTGMVDEIFNPNSPLQIRDILFTKLGLPIVKKTKTGASTDVDVLKKLSFIHPFPQLLLDYRAYNKIKTTYSDTLPHMIAGSTGRIHTSYIQTGTQTGRLSSKDPNLQNIPIRNVVGREIRKAFIPSAGNVMISADYSQIEIFLLAEFSKDPLITEALESGIDIHLKTAALIFDKEISEITKSERSVAKTVNFGILYGQSAFSLADDLNISRKDASRFIEKYFENYKGVKTFIESLKEKCKNTGYSETHWGRRRTIPEINEKNKMIRENGERMAVNTVIQGTAADLIKLAMIKIYRKICDLGLKSKLILQVHDELIFDVPENEVDTIIPLIKQSMEMGYGFNLKLKTNVEIGKTWGDMH